MSEIIMRCRVGLSSTRSNCQKKRMFNQKHSAFSILVNVFFSASIIVCIQNCTEGALINLPPVAAEVGYQTVTGWVTESVPFPALQDLNVGIADVNLVSTSWPYAGPGSFEVRSPELMVWFDASKLTEGSPITFISSANVCDFHGDTVLHYSFYHPSYGWSWDVSNNSWNTAFSAETSAVFNRGGWSAPPLYWVNSASLIGVRLSAAHTAGGGLPPGERPPPDMTLDVHALRITGFSDVPEPGSIILLLAGFVCILFGRLQGRGKKRLPY